MEPDEPGVRVATMEGVLGLPATDPGIALVDAIELGVPFSEFYKGSRDRIARALALTLGDVHLGADAADEAMLRAYERWDRVGAFTDPGGWAYRVGLNWATSVLRRRRRAPSPPVERGADETSPVAEPSILAALRELAVGQRSVIVCRYYLGMSEAETAAALNIRPGTVKSRLHRGLHELRDRLAHLHLEEQQ